MGKEFQTTDDESEYNSNNITFDTPNNNSNNSMNMETPPKRILTVDTSIVDTDATDAISTTSSPVPSLEPSPSASSVYSTSSTLLTLSQHESGSVSESSISSFSLEEEQEHADVDVDSDIDDDALVPHVTLPTRQKSSIVLTIQGLYTKRVILRARELPINYTVKDMKRDQFMCRKRLITQPLDYIHEEEEVEEEESQFEMESTSTTTSADADADADVDVDANVSPAPAPAPKKKYDTAYFEPIQGLINGFFWHTDERKNPITHKSGMPDRAILFQAMNHYEHLMKHDQFQDYFKDVDVDSHPTFGEQVIVRGDFGDDVDGNDDEEKREANQICIGDVFIVEDNLSSLVIEVSSPRKPCYAINKRHGTPMGPTKGIKTYTMQHGLAGWFTRVLVGGELRDGMKLVRVKNPHPKWNLEYISHVLFKEGMKSDRCVDLAMCRQTWNVKRETGLDELRELIALPQLANYEWKEDAKDLLKQLEQEQKNNKQHGTRSTTGKEVRCMNGIGSLVGLFFFIMERIIDIARILFPSTFKKVSSK